MKLGIMQPYFFPYIGYFALIARTDRWVVFDTVQYIRHGWVNRNRILHPARGWQYILVPLQKHGRDTTINQIQIAAEQDWRQKILRQLDHYRRRAPFFQQTMDLVEACLSCTAGRLVELNTHCLARVCAYLDIPLDMQVFSALDLPLGPVHAPGDWALRIAQTLEADEYINPPGGADLFEPAAFAAAGIQLTIQQPIEHSYPTPGYSFEANLSIIDVLMWNSPESVRRVLYA